MGLNNLSAVGSATDMTATIRKRVSVDLTGKSGVDAIRFENEITTIDSKLTSDFLQKTIDRVNKQLTGINREFNYSIHEGTGQFIVKILDRDTKEVLREIPPEKTLDLVAKMWELAGIFLDEKI